MIFIRCRFCYLFSGNAMELCLPSSLDVHVCACVRACVRVCVCVCCFCYLRVRAIFCYWCGRRFESAPAHRSVQKLRVMASLSCVFLVLLHCCFTSTETVGIVRDGEPRTATPPFTQILSSALSPSLPALCFPCSPSVLLYVHRDRKDY